MCMQCGVCYNKWELPLWVEMLLSTELWAPNSSQLVTTLCIECVHVGMQYGVGWRHCGSLACMKVK